MNRISLIAWKLLDSVVNVIPRLRWEQGQTMSEYAILLVVVAIVALAGATLLGKSISSIFSSFATKL
jgi:Flp pilus assembly pilin Flp